MNNVKDINVDDTQISKVNQYLTFKLKHEIYGIEIEHITQILGMMKITRLPEMPNFIKGVINLRGKVFPVIDVRTRFKIEEMDYTERTCIIVINIKSILVGLIVDEVLEVIAINDQNIEPTPEINKSVDSRFIKGLGKIDESVNIILDTNRLLFDEELLQIEAVS